MKTSLDSNDMKYISRFLGVRRVVIEFFNKDCVKQEWGKLRNRGGERQNTEANKKVLKKETLHDSSEYLGSLYLTVCLRLCESEREK